MAVSKAVRKRTSPLQGTKKGKLPMPDAEHARNALARMNQVSGGLAADEKKAVARKAEKVIGHSTPKTRKILGKGKKS